MYGEGGEEYIGGRLVVRATSDEHKRDDEKVRLQTCWANVMLCDIQAQRQTKKNPSFVLFELCLEMNGIAGRYGQGAAISWLCPLS